MVTLTGTVESEAMRERIVDATANVKGVKDVNDHLKVDAVQTGDETGDRR